MKLKVSTFNFRMQTNHDGVNAFFNRLPFIVDFIKSENIDIIGAQELLPNMRAALVSELQGYYIVGQGRGRNNFDECNTVIFNASRFALSSCDTFWLSHTPNVPGSRYESEGQSVCPRICTMCKFIELNEGTVLRFYNTHLDHVGSIPRFFGMKQIIKVMSENFLLDRAFFILTGDMNALPDSPEIVALSEFSPKLVDLSENVEATYHGYGTDSTKIDYIFAPENVKLLTVRAAKEKRDELWLSDHYPVIVEIEI